MIIKAIPSKRKVANVSPYLLDNYPGSVAAYSTRKLSSTYTGQCMRVRRSYDNTELDIGFTDIDGKMVLDTPALMDFVTGPYGSWTFSGGLYQGAGGNGLVVNWYDQSGNNNTAYQTNASQQQAVVLGGTRVALQDKNSVYQKVPYLHSWHSGGGKAPLTLTNTITMKTAFTLGLVMSQNSINYIFFGSGGAWYNGSYVDAKGLGLYDGVSAFSLTGEDFNTHLGYFNMASGRMLIAKDGTAAQDLGASLSSITVNKISGRDFSSALYFRGAVLEMIFYNSDQSANKTGIENNINSYFNTY